MNARPPSTEDNTASGAAPKEQSSKKDKSLVVNKAPEKAKGPVKSGRFETVRGAAAASSWDAAEPRFDELPAHVERGESAAPTAPSARTPTRPSARFAIVEAAVRRALTPAVRRRLSRSTAPLALIVQVPAAGWIRPVQKVLTGLNPKVEFFARDGSNRREHVPGEGNAEVATALMSGRHVVGIAVDPKSVLPRTLMSCADIAVTMPRPEADAIRQALRACLPGRTPAVLDQNVFDHLDLDDLVAAMRKGATRTEAVSLMHRAASRSSEPKRLEDVPLLENAFEFGAARVWGLDLVRDLSDYRAQKIAWAQVGSAAMFFGPSGTGKTLIAKTISAATRLKLISTSVGDFFRTDGHLGAVIKAQREIFSRARSCAPCILHLDECDAIPHRASLGEHAHWWLPVVDDFLLQVSERADGIVLLGSTNWISRIDPALLRPGRFTTAIEIGPPDFRGVVNVLRFHLRDHLRHESIDDVARMAEGATSAELMDIVNRSLRAARREDRDLRMDDLRQAIIGEATDDPATLMRLAIHESAHAVASIVIGSGSLRHAAIGTKGGAGGHTRIDDEPILATLEDYEKRCIVLLAGGLAEKLFYSAPSTGWSGADASDLGLASRLLAAAHASGGLTGRLFQHAPEHQAVDVVRLDPTLRREVEAHLQRLATRTEEIVGRHRADIERIAAALAVRRHLDVSEITALMDGPRDPHLADRRSKGAGLARTAQPTVRLSPAIRPAGSTSRAQKAEE